MGIAKMPLRRFDPRSDVLDHVIDGQVTLSEESLAMMVRDISDSGLKIAVTKALEVGSRVKINLVRPVAVNLVAEVRWCRASDDGDLWWAGVRIEDRIDVLSALQRYIALDGAASFDGLTT